MRRFTERNLAEFKDFLHDRATIGLSLTIGNFDGVHLGHQSLISKSVEWARKNGGISVVLTFYPHPIEVLTAKPHIRIFSFEDQFEQIQELGVDVLFTQKFDINFASLTADKFMNEYIMQNFSPAHIVVGYDFSFGKGKSGAIDFLRSYCFEKGIQFEQVPAVIKNGEVVSTSLIRKKIEAADMSAVKDMLGRFFYLDGIIVKGDQRGRQIGFPTANLESDWDFIPPAGVYITQTVFQNQTYHSVTNIGVNPTFNKSVEPLERQVKIETHILDFHENIYNKKIRVEFLKKIRSEMKFENVEKLISQIQKDILVARKYSL